jgi:hypothetical protein
MTDRGRGPSVARYLGAAALLGVGIDCLQQYVGANYSVSEHTPLFGFMEYGYRQAIVISIVLESVALVLLGAYLVGTVRWPNWPGLSRRASGCR